jgi:L-lactate dehydrogenase complex protein LldG
LADVELAVLRAHFAVAENGAVWITDEQMGNRVLPFICQHLAIVINETAIVPTMHDAYPIIGKQQYNFGSFIAGPSKTADIEQSLVLGAHGPRSMAIFVLLNHNDQH